MAAGRGNFAAAEFQKILDHNGIVWNCWTGALAHLGAALAYALESATSQGADADVARTRALTAYKGFLTLWRGADPDIPVLILQVVIPHTQNCSSCLHRSRGSAVERKGRQSLMFTEYPHSASRFVRRFAIDRCPDRCAPCSAGLAPEGQRFSDDHARPLRLISLLHRIRRTRPWNLESHAILRPVNRNRGDMPGCRFRMPSSPSNSTDWTHAAYGKNSTGSTLRFRAR